MVRTAINVYSVRELEDSVTELIHRVADNGYDGIQFSGDHTPFDGDLESIRATLDETGLDTPPAHVSIDDLEGDLENVLSTYEAVGVDELVLSYLSDDHFETADAVGEIAARINDIDTELRERGSALHYHNHDHEFVELPDGSTGFETFIEETEIKIELDVGWALYAGRHPAALIEEYGDRMDVIHMKDVDTSAEWGECFREIGTGDVDMSACENAARDTGVDWLIYEHDAPENPAESVRHGAEFLASL